VALGRTATAGEFRLADSPDVRTVLVMQARDR
jgi:hypothetical protein